METDVQDSRYEVCSAKGFSEGFDDVLVETSNSVLIVSGEY